MSHWVMKGIATGIKTTAYPLKEETAGGVTPGLPIGGQFPIEVAQRLVEQCPTQALHRDQGSVSVDYRGCIHCYRCHRDGENSLTWKNNYEWGFIGNASPALDPSFHRSIHILVVDAGDCGACLNEVKQLNNPYYNMHRLGFFITPTPRHADVLMVVGPVTDQMRFALKKIYQAMPTPKRVIAVGACALSGGVFAESFACAKGVAQVLPVDVQVPGNPPSPLAILHGLLALVGRKASASLTSPQLSAKEAKP